MNDGSEGMMVMQALGRLCPDSQTHGPLDPDGSIKVTPSLTWNCRPISPRLILPYVRGSPFTETLSFFFIKDLSALDLKSQKARSYRVHLFLLLVPSTTLSSFRGVHQTHNFDLSMFELSISTLCALRLLGRPEVSSLGILIMPS